ncbi:unnamed protein product, partial [Urochloa humidicola]
RRLPPPPPRRLLLRLGRSRLSSPAGRGCASAVARDCDGDAAGAGARRLSWRGPSWIWGVRVEPLAWLPALGCAAAGAEAHARGATTHRGDEGDGTTAGAGSTAQPWGGAVEWACPWDKGPRSAA